MRIRLQFLITHLPDGWCSKIMDLPKLHETLTRKKYKHVFSVISIGVDCFTFVLSKVFYLDVNYNHCFTEPFLACADTSPRNTWSRPPRDITVQSDISTFRHVSIVLQRFNWCRDYKDKITEISKRPFLNCIINALSLNEMRFQRTMIVVYPSPNKHSVQDGKYNYHDSLQGHVKERAGHFTYTPTQLRRTSKLTHYLN